MVNTLAAKVRLASLPTPPPASPGIFLKVTYGTISPFGVPQQVIMINNQFPGPVINCTSNNNIVVNVFNHLDVPFLLSWNGIQQRKNSWQEGMPRTSCPILPRQNFTYKWQPKDQIGTFFYYPTIGTQKAAGGYGPIRVHSRALIPVPFDPPANEFDVLISDWYGIGHKELARFLDSGRHLTRSRGVIINGLRQPSLGTSLCLAWRPAKSTGTVSATWV
ncbi:hypothetical protein HPP92_022888 [Vanilla planifolia]|uniref:Plastocyanin-like domain-containing protein n=1 Tax=Vanilla planifolia TaxID=51239 RepID=A0A835PPC4_VANPL|nr:hypothetical protein HPP92_022888 [Vanilla planifolia]